MKHLIILLLISFAANTVSAQTDTTIQQTDSIYKVTITSGQYKSLIEGRLCHSIIKKGVWEDKNTMDKLIVGPFASKEEAEKFVTDNKECLSGYNVSVSVNVEATP